MKLKDNWALLALFAFYIYLAFHALSGNQGLMRWADYEKDIARYETELKALQAEREDLQARVDALDRRSLDLDALDIAARKAAFVSRQDEMTIWLDPTP